MLHEVVRENLETFLAQSRARTGHGFGVPRFVDVAFSCQRRGACPSCSGRRAAACAIHLVHAVFPSTPTRTLTFPRRLRFALAKDARLATTILGIWHRALSSFYRLVASNEGFRATRTGAVTFVHRFA